MENVYHRTTVRLYEKRAEAGRKLACRAEMADNMSRMRGKSLKVVAFPQGGHSVPSIRVAGKWLERFGFQLGDGVSLIAAKGRVVITKREEV